MVAEAGSADELSRKIYASYQQFRALTNRLISESFGMDVEGYRRYKNLLGTNQNLRDRHLHLGYSFTVQCAFTGE